MGGSALPADILSMWLETNSKVSLHIHRDYGLPHHADGKHLVICISYSGNTEETISAFEEARKKNLKVLAIASGGKLVELCRSRKIPVAIIPSGLQPRMALGFQFAALMKILSNSGLIKTNPQEILKLENSLKPKKLENLGKELAEHLKNKMPLIYASRRLASLARIWKIKFNENSKIPAFCNYFPELNHNELLGFTKTDPKLFSIVILRDSADHPRNLKRIELTKNILEEKSLAVDIVEIMGKDILYKVFSNILLADWTSYHLALGRGIDPTPVKLNDEFKKRLAK